MTHVSGDLARMVCAVDDETRSRDGSPRRHRAFDRLVRTIWRLRQDDGCPWDKAQTHRSLAACLLEEAYEAVDAIEADDVGHLREELGDMLEVVLLNAQIAEDEGEFTLDEVCDAINEKVVRRHPHVFGEVRATSPEAALGVWDAVKRQEREARAATDGPPGLLDSVPTSLPALIQCQKISQRAARVGFDWEDARAAWEKVTEERDEFEREQRGSEGARDEFGDILFALVNVARHEGIDAEAALAASNRKFRRRWAAVERMARSAGRDAERLSAEELNALWDRVKADEGTTGGPTAEGRE